jgi:hypothetical protein
MKTTTFALGALGTLLLAALASCKKGDHYGAPFLGFPRAEISALVERPSEHYRKDLRIEGVVTRQCPATGCWFHLRDAAGKEVKVEMGDTVPRLPPRKGKGAAVEGRLIPYGDRIEFVGTAVEFSP